jgi:hypothetical protein
MLLSINASGRYSPPRRSRFARKILRAIGGIGKAVGTAFIWCCFG